MFDLLFWLCVFFVSLVVLVKASDFFTDSAAKIGLRFGIPSFIVGVTIVAFGTSLPELISSMVSIFWGVSDVAIGNVIGSNIANIFLIIGIVTIISKKIKIFYELKHVDLPFLVGSTLLLSFILFDGKVMLFESILLIIILIIYLLYTISTREKRSNSEIKKEIKKDKELFKEKRKLKKSTWIWLFVGLILIYFSSQWTVSSVLALSNILNIKTGLIAISLVAIGTSLPELAVSVTAARKNQPEIAIGNVIGSNIFNSLAVVGIPGLIGGLVFGAVVFEVSIIAILVMVSATLLYYFMVEDKEISFWEGWLLLIFYIFFLAYLFGLV
jgi:cation:H+ antiporter